MSRTSSLPDHLRHLRSTTKEQRMATQEEFEKLFGIKSEPRKQSDEKPAFATDGEHAAVLKDAGVGSNSVGEYLYWQFYFPEFRSEETSYFNLPPKSEAANKALFMTFRSLDVLPESAEPEALAAAAKQAIGFTLLVRKNSKKGDKQGPDGRTKWFRSYQIRKVLDNKATPVEKKVEEDDGSFPF